MGQTEPCINIYTGCTLEDHSRTARDWYYVSTLFKAMDMKNCCCYLGRSTFVLQCVINICTNGKMISCQSEWYLMGRPTVVQHIYPGYIHICTNVKLLSGQLEGHILYYYLYLLKYKSIDRKICWRRT